MKTTEDDSYPEKTGADKRTHDRNRALAYVVWPPIFLGLLYFVTQVSMAVVAKSSSAPDQGAMFIVGLIFIVGGIAALVVFVEGVILLLSLK